ncbi:hypothetical protein PHMEG_0005995 [Phytophthora megakarya]|uniref:Uncharacterized protein n=1 Tax=Phytophthora megakarya TaxID=4795 RepID=A0A225WQ28_9STRA|nr:hypothetical protein PHMEG_0005995 [Phytophthora megakarya]
MPWVLLVWLALTFGLTQAQGHLAIDPRYPYGWAVSPQSFTTCMSRRCRIQQLAMVHHRLQGLTARLRLEVQELLAIRNHEQLQEPRYQGKCECESINTLTTPTPAPVEPMTKRPEPANEFDRNASWQLKSTGPNSGSTSAGTSSSHTEPYFASTMFVLAVFFMAIPVACIIGFVVFCRRRRQQRHTHV